MGRNRPRGLSLIVDDDEKLIKTFYRQILRNLGDHRPQHCLKFIFSGISAVVYVSLYIMIDKYIDILKCTVLCKVKQGQT